jgi:polyhydroxyalkanoate synthesis regulator phasin
MAGRRTPQDTLKEAVERTVQAGQVTRDRAQGSLDELVSTVRGALEAGRPATHDDMDDLRKELRAIGRRLDKIEKQISKSKKK